MSSVSEGIVNLASTPVWNFDYEAVTAFGDLQLAQLSLIDASGLSGGQIRLRGAGISSSDGSVVLTRNLGGPSRGSIDVVADEIAIGDSALEEPVITPFLTQNLGTGEGASIRVLTQEISLQNGGWISTNTFTDGSSGDIEINASESIGVRGFNSLEESFVSNILALTSGPGDAGGIKLTSRELSVQDGAVVISITIGPAANAGTVEIDADEILVDGGLPTLEVPSLIGSFTLGFGNSDQLSICADSIRVLNGGTIFTSTIGSGNAGDTTIQSRDFIEVSGELPGGINPSSIASSATLANPIVQNLLTLAQAPLPENLPDFLSPLAGDAGSISVETPDLTIQDGGTISVQNDGTGDAGVISVSSDNIRLSSSGAILAATNSGDGGNINLSSDTLLLNQSRISSAASGNGSGGNITIGNDVLALIDNSQITANAQLGSGGQVVISTTGLFEDPSSTITATSAAGPQLDGSVLIQSPEVDLSRAGTLEAPTVQPPQTAPICAGRQDAGRSEFVATGTGGVPISPDVIQRSYSGWSDAESSSSSDTLLSEVTPSTIVEAQGFAFNPDGTFSLALVADNALIQSESEHGQNCLSEALGDS